MNLTEDQRLAAVYALAEFLRRRRLTGQPIPRSVVLLHQQLSMSSAGHESDSSAEELNPEMIGASEAAQILGCSRRHVTRLHADLDGHRCGNRYIYNRQTVLTYSEAKGDNDHGQ